MSYKAYTQPIVDSNKIFKDNIFDGKVLFCTGGLDRVVRSKLEQKVKVSRRSHLGNTCRTVSISMTVRNAFSDKPEMGARKLPAAPILCKNVEQGEPQSVLMNR